MKITELNLTNFKYKNFSAILKQYRYSMNCGDVIAGNVFSWERDGALVDIGSNLAAYLPKEEININSKNPLNSQDLYSTQDFFILDIESESKQIILSLKRLHYLRSWKRIKQLYAENINVETSIKKETHRGIIVSIESLDGFIPNYQIGLLESKYQFKKFKTNITVKLLSIAEEFNKIILSHRHVLFQNAVKKLNIGDIVECIVSDIKVYGVFVKVNNIQGLLHISEIPSDNIKSLNEIFYINKKVNMMIIHIDRKQARLSLSMNTF